MEWNFDKILACHLLDEKLSKSLSVYNIYLTANGKSFFKKIYKPVCIRQLIIYHLAITLTN